MSERVLECQGRKCPLPVVRASQTMKTMGVGERLRVISTDPAFHADIQAWTRRLGHTLVEFKEGPPCEAVIEKA